VTLLYRATSPRDLAFRDELSALADWRGVRLFALIGPGTHDDQTDKLGIPALRALIPDIAQRDVFLCGPPAMVKAVRRRLAALRVPRRHIHFERFAY
jgi:ferredoxin-NADP reductase